MPRLKKQGSFYSLIFSQKDALDHGLAEGQEYELFNATGGIWVLVAKEIEGKENQTPERKVLKLISSLPLKERVFGVFEKKLNKDELNALKKLIAEKKVIEFKLSDKYKKHVYKTKEEIYGEGKGKTGGKEKQIHGKQEPKNSSKEKQEFFIFSNDAQAQKFSSMNYKALKEGEVKGMKCFDGSSCFIKSDLFDSVSEKITLFMDSRDKATLEEISKELKIDKNLIKVAIEFLKEDGLVLEKKKNLFKLIN
jgi:hypothetical protein